MYTAKYSVSTQNGSVGSDSSGAHDLQVQRHLEVETYPATSRACRLPLVRWLS